MAIFNYLLSSRRPVTTRVMLLLVHLKLSYRSTYRAFSVNIAFFFFEEKLLILAKLE